MTNLESIKSKVSSFKYIDYLRSLKILKESADISKNKPLRIAILRSYSAEMIEPVLKLRLVLDGYDPTFFWGDYNQYTQEILDATSDLYTFKPDLVLLLVRIEELMPSFVWRFGEKDIGEWKEEINKNSKYIAGLISTLNEKISVQVIVQNMCLPVIPYWGVYEAQENISQTDLLQEFNQTLRTELLQNPTTYIWDYNNFLLRKGYEKIYDPKLMYIASNPFKQSSYPLIVDDLMRYISSVLGKGKKCIVLDLDNTLWGGVIGEDGFDGIALGDGYPGNCFVDFQKELLKLCQRGVILAINSKNNEKDAFDVIDNHPNMILRKKNFAAYKINWLDKANNLKMLANELNIGIDSMIFIDDNPVECEWVREQCPECTVVQVPKEHYLMPSIVPVLPGIENIRLTNEDKKKGEIYQAQVRRKGLQESSADLGDFLKGLEMEVEIKKSEKFSVSRISQLTQKTNQFNMTTRRYTEKDIVKFANSPENYVFSVSAKDRFGDNGIIGVVILKFENDFCLIDTFLLSCRVISRSIEQSMIAFIAEFARKKGAVTVIGEFIPTAKNKPASNFYSKMNFTTNDDKKFIADLKKQSFEYSPYITHLNLSDY